MIKKQIYNWSRKITILSYAAFLLFIVVFFIVNGIFGYGITDDNYHFHLPSFVLNNMFALTMLFNDFCAFLSFLLLLLLPVRREKMPVKEWIKNMICGIYPLLLIAAFWSFDVAKIIEYFKTPFKILSIQWEWLYNCFYC